MFIERAFYSKGIMFGTLATGREIHVRASPRSDVAYYRFVLAMVLVVIVLVSTLIRPEASVASSEDLATLRQPCKASALQASPTSHASSCSASPRS